MANPQMKEEAPSLAEQVGDPGVSPVGITNEDRPHHRAEEADVKRWKAGTTEVMGRLSGTRKNIESQVRENPISSAVISFLTGCLIGMVLL